MSNSFQTVSTGVFDRHGVDKISSRVFFATLGSVLVYGFVATAYIANMTSGMFAEKLNWLTIIFVGLVIPILGIIIAVKSSNPFISFIGYNMVVIPFGIILAPVLQQYSKDVIQNAFTLTAIDVITMSMLAVIFPNFFSKIGGAIFISLIGLVVVRIAQCFIPVLANLTIIDWISAGIFSLYVGFDWWRANNVPKTFDNAIDIALDLYLDIINLFLSILRILGKKD
jgi:FtsH-binding integral membrane protein